MSEAVKFRLKVLNNNLLLATSAITMVISYFAFAFSAIFTYGITLWVTQFVSWAILIWGVWGLVMYKANDDRGRCRIVMEFLGGDYDDPPLSEWEDSLEARGAFEVSYESE